MRMATTEMKYHLEKAEQNPCKISHKILKFIKENWEICETVCNSKLL